LNLDNTRNRYETSSISLQFFTSHVVLSNLSILLLYLSILFLFIYPYVWHTFFIYHSFPFPSSFIYELYPLDVFLFSIIVTFQVYICYIVSKLFVIILKVLLFTFWLFNEFTGSFIREANILMWLDLARARMFLKEQMG
jgi:hypothetical protein